PTGEFFKWDISDGLIAKKFPVLHQNDVVSFAFNSEFLFTGSIDATIIRWDAVSEEILFRYSGKNSKIRSVASWKNFIISGGDDEEIRMWDASIDSLDPFAVIDQIVSTINILYIFEDIMYIGDNSNSVKVMSLTSLTLIRTLKAPGDAIVSLLSNHLFLYGGGFFGSIYQWNISSGIQTAVFSAHSDHVRSLQLTDDLLYSGSWDSFIKTWQTKSLESINAFQALSTINGMLIDEEYLIVCTDSSVEMFSIISGKRTDFVQEPFACYCVVSRGSIVYTGHVDGLVRVRTLNSLISFETYAGHVDIVSSLCFDEVFNLYSAGFDGAVKKWNIASRRVAFSFENKNGSVSTLGAYQNQLLVGLKSGRIDYYDTENAMSLISLYYHSNAVSSLVAFNDSVYSSSSDGAILKISTGDRNYTNIYKSDQGPLSGLVVRNHYWIALQRDTKIIISSTNLNSKAEKFIEFQTPLVSVAATESALLVGSKSGIIYAWSIETLQPAFELRGHVSPVNFLLVVNDRLFSASDDKTIIEWSLNSKTTSRTYKRLSVTALGHLGPVNSLSICTRVLFSAGSDNTVRRWNTQTGKHEDVYFGFTKSVTSVVCYNGSVFAG
ncbi:hypothetical protein MP638_004245, partial [Amoeboaphelidium occidentale]